MQTHLFVFQESAVDFRNAEQENCALMRGEVADCRLEQWPRANLGLYTVASR
jgi:hypothetical protein